MRTGEVSGVEKQTEGPLTGKTAIVTGASRGIGKQTALSLARRGANIVIAARTVEARSKLPGTLGETLDAIQALGVQALAVQADMAEEADLERLVSESVEHFGGVDILVNNAAATGGRAWSAPLLELTREQWMSQYAVNLHAPYTLIRALAPLMAERGGGRVINVTTGSPQLLGQLESQEASGDSLGEFSSVGLAYLSSKAALDRFCGIVAPQLRPLNVSIVNVHPGAVHTELVDILVERGLDASSMIAMDIPSRALTYMAACADPMAYTGQLFVAERIVGELQLS